MTEEEMIAGQFVAEKRQLGRVLLTLSVQLRARPPTEQLDSVSDQVRAAKRQAAEA